VSAFATARTDGYTSNNKRSKSILAPASSLAHDIDSTSNRSVTLGGTGTGGARTGIVGGEGAENVMSCADSATVDQSNGSAAHTDTADSHIDNISNNTTSDNNESEIDKNKQKKKNDVTVVLSSNGRIVSANNKHSFNSTTMTNTDVKIVKKDETEGESEATSYLVKRPRNEEMGVEREGKSSVRRGESKCDNSADAEVVKDVVIEAVIEAVQGDSRSKKDEGRSRYPSKSSKWLDFASWVEGIRNADADKEAELLKANCANTHARYRTYDVIVDGANVGYYKQNFNGAPTHIDYRQVDWMLRQLILRGTVLYSAVQRTTQCTAFLLVSTLTLPFLSLYLFVPRFSPEHLYKHYTIHP
jgi:hypothetical protein